MSTPLVNAREVWNWANPGWWPKVWRGQVKAIRYDPETDEFYVSTVSGDDLKFVSIDAVNLWARTCARLER